MPRQTRGEVIDPSEVQVVHCIQCCVRRAFLRGDDPVSGRSFEHRRGWIQDRLEFLASVFGIDCLTYTVLSNHMHLDLRSRPDVVAAWSDEDVARRWLRLFPKRRNEDDSPGEPQQNEIDMIVNQPDVLAERRRRLSDLSWWMKCTAENIARLSNREDETTGHFWEGRFRAQLLLDESALLACAAYVDLNPIRAAMAETPEESEYTGAKDRLDDLADRGSPSRDTHAWERSRRRAQSGWMSPIEIDERSDQPGPDVNPTTHRASQKGVLSVSLSDYLQLLDWTGRALRSDRRGSIPAHLSPILTRIGLDAGGWCEIVSKFGKLFKRAAGTAEHLCEEAGKRGQIWLQAPGNPLAAAN